MVKNKTVMNLQILEKPELGQVQMKLIKGEPWFVAKDVCDVLELSDVNKSVTRLDDDEKLIRKIFVSGQNREMWTVNESGLYNLIFRSTKPQAKVFRKWVTTEVLPSIRKYGYYSTDARKMKRAIDRAERKEIKKLLESLRSSLSATDLRQVARQCHCKKWEVDDVLSGRVEDATMLSLLYARATGNRRLYPQFYTMGGAQRLLEELRD